MKNEETKVLMGGSWVILGVDEESIRNVERKVFGPIPE